MISIFLYIRSFAHYSIITLSSGFFLGRTLIGFYKQGRMGPKFQGLKNPSKENPGTLYELEGDDYAKLHMPCSSSWEPNPKDGDNASGWNRNQSGLSGNPTAQIL